MSSTRATERVILASAFTLSASNSVVFALMGNLQDRFRFSDAGLGLIAGAGFLTSFLVQVFVAPLADRGRTRFLMLLGPILAILGNVVFATGSSLGQFVIARAIAGSAAGCFYPPARALMANLHTTGHSERLGAISGIDLAGFVTGPVIGGFLVGPLGLRWPFVIFSISAGVALFLVATRPLPSLPRGESSAGLPFGLLRDRAVLAPIMLLVALALPVGMYDSLWDRFLTDLGASDVVVGLSLAAYAIPFVALSRIGGRLADRRGHLLVAYTGIFVVAPFTALYGQFSVAWIPIALGTIESCAQACSAPAAAGLLAKNAPVGRAAAAQGLAGACNQLVAAVVAIVATWGYGHLSPHALFGLAGLAVLIVGTMAKLVANSLRVSPEPDARTTSVS